MRFFIFKLKRLIIPTCICIFILFLVLFSSNNLLAAKNGLLLWGLSVVPSLLPFFIATELLGYTNVVPVLGKLLNRFMRPIFNVPGEGAFALIMGIVSGYPVGAKIVSNLKKQGVCSSEECERLLSFTNNSGPLFIIGTVGVSLFSNSKIGIQLFFVHLVSCLLVGFLFRWWKCKNNYSSGKRSNTTTFNYIGLNNLGSVLSTSIQSAIHSVVIIGGFVVLFSVIVSMLSSSKILSVLCTFLNPFLHILKIPTTYSSSIITGIIEVTNGVKLAAIDTSHFSVIICSFLLGFGGISVLLQVLSITSEAKISIKPYILGKLLQACFSAIFMYLLLL
ncbi:MAG: sporulation integral membrane protein YlbJ [Clostridia bacterium]